MEHDARQVNGEQGAQATLQALLGDLETLHGYLSERGRHTYALAQRFLENARRDVSNRAFDERQAAMLEYQHYIWHEIAGMVSKLLVTYGGAEPDDETEASERNDPEGAN